MRIRGSSINPSPSLSLSSISGFASSSSNSLNSSSSITSFSIDYETRCEGLDLLVKAAFHLAGSVLCVPFTQKRVIRRRKRAFRFIKFLETEFDQREEPMRDEGVEVISKSRRKKREMALPSKYQDSVLQPWKRRTRQRCSTDVDGASG